MHKLEEKLKNLMLKNIKFLVDDKVVKKGKVKVYNTKQFFLRFKLEQEGKLYEYDLPYPFKVTPIKDGYLFDYCLSAFCPRSEDIYWKMKLMDKTESSKLHDNYLYIRVE
jgi:hypothetical protein